MKNIDDSVIAWLLEEDNPSVRYATLVNLLDRPSSDRESQEAFKAIMGIGPVPKILSLQQDDGSWGDPARFYRDKYKGTSWTLLILAELGADKSSSEIQNACRFILENSFSPEVGGFSYDRSSTTHTGLPGCVIPCLTGNMVYALIKLGYLEDARVQAAINWICTYQRTDDGDDGKPDGAIYKRLKACFSDHTCFMGAAKALKALAAIPEDSRSDSVQQKISELTEFFLKHHIFKMSHDLEKVSRPGWLKFRFPLMYQTDVLELLGIFASLGIRDDRLNEALDLLEDKLFGTAIIKKKPLEIGTLKMEGNFNGKMVVDIEQNGKPSKWLTYKALYVLRHLRNY